MDSVTTLPSSSRGNNAVSIIVERLTKSAYFISCRVGQSIDQLVERYMQEIVRLHGVPTNIISNMYTRFTPHYCKSLQGSLGTRLKYSAHFHPQTDGQSEKTMQIVEDTFRTCILDFKGTVLR